MDVVAEHAGRGLVVPVEVAGRDRGRDRNDEVRGPPHSRPGAVDALDRERVGGAGGQAREGREGRVARDGEGGSAGAGRHLVAGDRSPCGRRPRPADRRRCAARASGEVADQAGDRREMRDQRIPELGRPSAVVEGEDAHPTQVEPVDGVVLVAERNRVVEILLAVAAPVRVVPGVPLADPLLGITVGREVGDAGLRPDGGGIEVGRVDVIADQGLMCIGQVSDTTAAAVVRLAQDDLARRDARRVLGHRLGDVEAVGIQRRHGAEAVRRAVERGLVVVGPIHVVGHDKEGVDVRRQTGDVEEPGVVFG